MLTVLKFRGAYLQVDKRGRLYCRIPYGGVFAVKPGDKIVHGLGTYTVTGKEVSAVVR
jgi:hypothetical protein